MTVRFLGLCVAVLIGCFGCQTRMSPLEKEEWAVQKEELEEPPASPHAASPVERPAPPPMDYGY